jgi:hypothetical protein
MKLYTCCAAEKPYVMSSEFTKWPTATFSDPLPQYSTMLRQLPQHSSEGGIPGPGAAQLITLETAPLHVVGGPEDIGVAETVGETM